MTTPDRREWLALLEAELARRAARTEWQAGEDERQRQWFIDTLQQIAQRFAVLAPMHSLDTTDMSPAEKLACHLVPESMRPAGLPTEAAIWAEYRARSPGSGPRR